jgi:glyoxylase-like metal-dependent hydrolase (beta-lactamase superfamily II)
MASKTLLAIGAALIALVAGPALAQQPPGPIKLIPHMVAPNVYWVEGGASNSGFVVGTTGVVAIDAQMNPDAARLALAEIARITPKPVNAIIITHSDPDHVGGLPAYAAGTAIIEQENSRAAILASAADPAAPPMLSALYHNLAANFPATKLVGESETITIDGVRMELIYVAPGHSAGDLIIFLPDQKVVFAGDVLTTNTGTFPIIHVGGSSIGWMESMRKILSLKAHAIISGHGAQVTRAQIATRLHDAEVRRAAIKAMVMQGKTLAEINQALPEMLVNPMFPSFNQTSFNELQKGYPGEAKGPWVNIVRKPQP